MALALKDERPDSRRVGDRRECRRAGGRAGERHAAWGWRWSSCRPICSKGSIGRFDAVLANLPYVAEGSQSAARHRRLRADVALFGGPDGLGSGPAAAADGGRGAAGRARGGAGRVRWRRWLGRRGLPLGRRSCATWPGTSGWWSGGVERRRRVRALHRGRGRSSLFPADTVYGLACDPDDRFAVERLYLLKRRSLDKPSAVMFFDVEGGVGGAAGAGRAYAAAMRAAAAGAGDRAGAEPGRAVPAGVWCRSLRRSACGCRRRAPVRRRCAGRSSSRAPTAPAGRIRAGSRTCRRCCGLRSDLVIDGGELPGTPSTVVDLRRYEEEGEWSRGPGRRGRRARADRGAALAVPLRRGHRTRRRSAPDIPAYDAFQDSVAGATGRGAARILDLGTGTGETARRVLAAIPRRRWSGSTRTRGCWRWPGSQLPAERVELRVGRIEEPLPEGPFDLVTSALCVHHLDGAGKADLFAPGPPGAGAGRAVRAGRRGGARRPGCGDARR